MGEKSAGIATILAAIMLITVFTTAMTLSMNAEGQTIIQTPGRTVVVQPTSENRTDIVCSGFSYTCG